VEHDTNVNNKNTPFYFLKKEVILVSDAEEKI
jgi:hypothetical protein